MNVSLALAQFNSEDEFSKALKRSISNYRKEKNKDHYLLDYTQIQMKCCGATDYKDWFKEGITIWDKHLPECEGENNRRYRPFIPFSCCNISSPHFCLHYTPEPLFDNLSSTSERFKYNHYKVGCIQKFCEKFNKDMVYFSIIWTISGGILILSAIGLQYLRISIHFAMLWSRRPDLSGIGWLWGPKLNTIDLTTLITNKEWAYSLVVQLLSDEESDQPFSKAEENELRQASKFIVDNGFVSTMDGTVMANVTKNAKKVLSEKMIEKVCSKVPSQGARSQIH